MPRRLHTDGHSSLREAARLTGLSPPMVDYLCRAGIVVPSGQRSRGRGQYRRYTFTDVVVLRAVARMLECGVAVTKLKEAFAALRRRHGSFAATSVPDRYLVATATRVYVRTGCAEVLQTIDGQGVFGFVMKIEDVRREVARMQNRGERAGKVRTSRTRSYAGRVRRRHA